MMSYRKINTEPDTTPRKIEFTEDDMKELDATQFGEFRRVIMGSINPSFYMCLFSPIGRPSCPVDLVIGIMILACFLGVSEDTILAQLKGNIYYQYALCMDAYSYVIPSKRTLIRMRMRIILYSMNNGEDVFHEQATTILQRLALRLHLKGDYYRMDSVMLNIYAKHLNRAQLVYYVIQGVVLRIVGASKNRLYESEKAKNLKLDDIADPRKIISARAMRHELADELASGAGLPKELWHYLYMDDYNSKFYRRGNSPNVSKEILEDATLLWRMYRKALGEEKEFLLFARVLRNQCEWVNYVVLSDGSSGVTHTVSRALHFKLSKTELDRIEKSRHDLAKLEDKELSLRKKQEKANEKSLAAKKKSMEASERAEKAKANGAANYEKLAEKARVLAQKAEELSQAAVKVAAEYDQAMETLGAELSLREAEATFVVVEDSMEGDIKRMDSNILQSPLDSWATFCEKSGKYYRGYKACILEMADGNGHSMPIEWITTQNNISDAVAGAILIRRLGKLYPEVRNKLVAADGAFSGNEIDAAAKNAGVEVVNTELTGQKTPDHIADFEFDDAGTQITKCAGNQTPKTKCSCTKDGMVSAVVDAPKCASCEHFNVCNPAIHGGKATVKASAKQKARAIFQRMKGADAHSAIGRFRNGVEALMNLFKKKTPVIKQPIYGQHRVSFYNDVAMIATGFSKYLSQMNIPHDEPRIDGDYFGLFPEDDAVVESERIEIERDLRRAARECEPASEEGFMSPMVIPVPTGAETVSVDAEQMTDETMDNEVADSAEAEASESDLSQGIEEEGSGLECQDAEENDSEPGCQDIAEDSELDCPDTEREGSEPDRKDTEGEDSELKHQDTEEENQDAEEEDSEPECANTEARGAPALGLGEPAIQVLGESSHAETPDTKISDILKRFYQGTIEVFPSKRSKRGCHAKDGGGRDTATEV